MERPGRRVMPKAVKVVRKLAVLREQLGVGRVGARIAALDIVDAELVEQLRDRQLVMQREVDAVHLRAVAQRGVEQIEAFLAHAALPADQAAQCRRAFRHASCFSIVVLDSHSPPRWTVLRR